MNDPVFYVGIRGIMQLIRQIWTSLFGIQFFDAPFTFGDVLIALFFVSMGLVLLRFFANSKSDSSGSDRKGISYK